jgi:hypothetical protein
VGAANQFLLLGLEAGEGFLDQDGERFGGEAFLIDAGAFLFFAFNAEFAILEQIP